MPANSPDPKPLKRAKRTKLKPVRFAPEELSALAEFLGGRDFAAVVRAYVLPGAVSGAPGGGPAVTCRVSFSAAEWAQIAPKLGSRDVADVLRSLLLEAPIPEPKTNTRREIVRVKMTESEAVQARHLAWIGNNLNQIARRANQAQGGGGLRILAALVGLERAVRVLAGSGGGTRAR